MAGFRIGRGRQPQNAQQGQQPPPGAPYPAPPGQGPPPHAYGQRPPHVEPTRPDWPAAPGSQDGPEYLAPPNYGDPHGGDWANSPGHTQSFTVGEAPDQGYGPGDYGPAQQYGNGGYPVGPRMHWKDLLRGIILRPSPTFWQMRDHAVWGPALIVTFLYGLLALFGLHNAREEAIHATLTTAIPYVLSTGIAVLLAGLMLGAVTHTMARQFGGDGLWQPTVGLSMLIMSLTDAPRLLFAIFLGGDDSFVRLLGWVTWLGAGVLFTMMVSRSHDLPWTKALGASSIQLVALLGLIKLGTI
ncbi:Yip1 family protein [Streptomyces sp. NPDC005438]|uniref:Yip1 family protein n=1 Tax=Streptomyces sp. NPDC005438 TaxID=3156880 RepID=UPI0033A56B89